MNTPTNHIVPSFAVSPDDGVALTATYWFETFETELRRTYVERMAARNQQASADSYVGWCFKRYERYLEACAEHYVHINRELV